MAIRVDEVNAEGDMEPIMIGPHTDLAAIPRVSAPAYEFSEDIARTNNELVLGYKCLQNEF